MWAARGSDQVAIRLNNERITIVAVPQAFQKVVQVRQRQVSGDHAFKGTCRIVHAPRARAHQLQRLEVDVDGCPGLASRVLSRFVPGALAWIEYPGFRLALAELTANSLVVVDRTYPLALQAQAQFGITLGQSVEAKKLPTSVAIVGIVVGLQMNRGRQPKAGSQCLQIILDGNWGWHIGGECCFQNCLGAGHMLVHRLCDALHHLGQYPLR